MQFFPAFSEGLVLDVFEWAPGTFERPTSRALAGVNDRRFSPRPLTRLLISWRTGRVSDVCLELRLKRRRSYTMVLLCYLRATSLVSPKFAGKIETLASGRVGVDGELHVQRWQAEFHKILQLTGDDCSGAGEGVNREAGNWRQREVLRIQDPLRGWEKEVHVSELHLMHSRSTMVMRLILPQRTYIIFGKT